MEAEADKNDMGGCVRKEKDESEAESENKESDNKKTGVFGAVYSFVHWIKETRHKKDDSPGESGETSTAANNAPAKKQGGISGKMYDWEQKLLDEIVVPAKDCQQACIVGFPHGELKAWSPPDFIPDNDGLQDVIEAFKGNVEPLAEKGIAIGAGTNVSVPGKLDEGKAIYGNDGKRGGCSIFKSDENLLFIVFVAPSDPAVANRLGLRTREHMIEHEKK